MFKILISFAELTYFLTTLHFSIKFFENCWSVKVALSRNLLDCVPFFKESLTFLKYLAILSFVFFFGFGIFLLASIQVWSLLNVPSLKSDGVCGSVFCSSNWSCSCRDNFFLLRVTSFHAILLWRLKCSWYCFVPAAPIWYPSLSVNVPASLFPMSVTSSYLLNSCFLLLYDPNNLSLWNSLSNLLTKDTSDIFH